MGEQKNPIQPVYTDEHGSYRFKANALVQYLLDRGGLSMNDLACVRCSQTDREQFAMLIGYSVSGFGSLNFASDETYEAATRMAELGDTEEQAKIAALEDILAEVRDGMRAGAARLYGVHPDDLGGE